MKRYFILGIIFIVGYNAFLIQRDQQLFESYNRPIPAQYE
jgi:hypothetical protein